MTGNALAATPDLDELNHMEWWSKKYAASKDLCPRAFRNKPDDILLVWETMRQKQVPFTLDTLNQCWVLDGRVETMAQLKVAIAARHGWDLWFVPTDPQGRPTGEVTDERAIVHYKGPGKPERTMEYTIKEARDNHLLDEWVETEIATGGKWPDGNPKTQKIKFVTAVDGQPTSGTPPEWAAAAKTQGLTRRKDPWFNSRQSMLMARAVTKGLRYAAPHLLLGLGDSEFDPVFDPVSNVDLDTGEVIETGRDGDSERVVDRMVPPRSIAPSGATIPEHLREPAIDTEFRDDLIAAMEALPDDAAGQVRQIAQDLGIPNLRSARATKAHGALVARLIAEAQSSPVPDQQPGEGNLRAPQERETVTPEVITRPIDEAPDGLIDADSLPFDYSEEEGMPF